MVLPLWAQENAIECVLLGAVVKLSKDLVLHLVLQPRLLKAKCAIASQPGRINKNNLCPDSGLTLAKVVNFCEQIPTIIHSGKQIQASGAFRCKLFPLSIRYSQFFNNDSRLRTPGASNFGRCMIQQKRPQLLAAFLVIHCAYFRIYL